MIDSKKDWLKDKYNLLFVIILVLTFLVKLYFFFLTANQPLWWDEAEYIATAKKWAFGIPYNVNIQRQPLFPLLITILFKLGFGLALTKFLLVMLPSFLIIVFTFYFANELYGKKVAIISTFLMAICWNLSFWSYRFSTDILGLFFGILCLYFFILGEKRNQNRFFFLSGLALSFGFLIRLPNIFIAIILFPYILLKGKEIFSKNFGKKIFLFIIAILIPLIPYLIYNHLVTGNPFTFAQSYFGIQATIEKTSRPIAWGVFRLIPLYFWWKPFFWVFLIGIASFYVFFIGIDLLLKKVITARYNFLIFLILLVPFLIIAFGERYYEERWGYLALPAIFIIFAKGIVWLESFFKKHQKKFLIILIIFLLVGTYINLNMLNKTLNEKKESFIQVRDTGLWLKENSDKEAIIFSNSLPQISAYSERMVYGLNNNQSIFIQQLTEYKADYLVLTAFEFLPSWMGNWLEKNQISLVKYFLIDDQIVVGIYNLKERNTQND